MVKLSHRGICVNDVIVSTHFYQHALGFEPYQDHGIIGGPDMEKTTELPGVRLRSVMLKRPDGPVVALLQFLEPAATGPRTKRSMLQYGQAHMSFYVNDIDAWAARIAEAGGTVHEGTRSHFPEADATMLYCTDPDGVRVELVKSPGQVERFSHSSICVADIDVARSYYEALGFKPAENYVLDQGFDWMGVLTEVPNIKLRVQMVRDSAGNTIELFEAIEPDSFGSRERQPINRFGLALMAFWDDDPAATAAALSARGGYFVEEAHTITPTMEFLNGADPNGVRIELLRARG